MENTKYIIGDSKLSKEEIERMSKITSYRVSWVRGKLYGEKDQIRKFIPFAEKYPIVGYYDSPFFLERLHAFHVLEEHPENMKRLIYSAEKVNWLEVQFLKYLEKIKLSDEAFLILPPLEKASIIREWMENDSIEDDFLM